MQISNDGMAFGCAPPIRQPICALSRTYWEPPPTAAIADRPASGTFGRYSELAATRADALDLVTRSGSPGLPVGSLAALDCQQPRRSGPDAACQCAVSGGGYRPSRSLWYASASRNSAFSHSMYSATARLSASRLWLHPHQGGPKRKEKGPKNAKAPPHGPKRNPRIMSVLPRTAEFNDSATAGFRCLAGPVKANSCATRNGRSSHRRDQVRTRRAYRTVRAIRCFAALRRRLNAGVGFGRWQQASTC
jgi:hypothetical protein